MSSNGSDSKGSSDSIFELSEEQIQEARVVVVDDDALVTSSLSSFLSLEVEIEPIIFNESPRAARYLAENEIDLIISDFLMPEMDGIQLLAEARRLQPEIPRVLLTGYADKENAIKAINEVRVFQYIEKPWDNEQLRRIVLNGLERLLLMRTLSTKIAELEKTRTDLAGLRKALVRTFA
jgi:DNA-binding NtrC family response regulator